MMEPKLYPPHSWKESNLDLVLPLKGHLFNVLSFSTSHIEIAPFSWKIILIRASISTT